MELRTQLRGGGPPPPAVQGALVALLRGHLDEQVLESIQSQTVYMQNHILTLIKKQPRLLQALPDLLILVQAVRETFGITSCSICESQGFIDVLSFFFHINKWFFGPWTFS